MCWKEECSTCKKWSWGGCGKHIDNAMNGIDMADRCLGWQKGKCPGVTNVNETACEACGQTFSAQTKESLVNVMEAHYKCSESCRPK